MKQEDVLISQQEFVKTYNTNFKDSYDMGRMLGKGIINEKAHSGKSGCVTKKSLSKKGLSRSCPKQLSAQKKSKC